MVVVVILLVRGDLHAGREKTQQRSGLDRACCKWGENFPRRFSWTLYFWFFFVFFFFFFVFFPFFRSRSKEANEEHQRNLGQALFSVLPLTSIWTDYFRSNEKRGRKNSREWKENQREENEKEKKKSIRLNQIPRFQRMLTPSMFTVPETAVIAGGYTLEQSPFHEQL